MPRMPARVLVVLLCSEGDAVTARQLTTELGVSPAAISSAVNHLMQVGLLTREPIPGSRQEHYRLPADGMLGAIMRKSTAAPDLLTAAFLNLTKELLALAVHNRDLLASPHAQNVQGMVCLTVGQDQVRLLALLPRQIQTMHSYWPSNAGTQADKL